MINKGQRINDRYEIISTIGEGGMANVYLAHDIILDRDVAVKVLRGDLANDEKFVRRFQREAIAASSLSHPNIVEMYDVGEDNGKYFIVMEYVEGRTLKSLIKRRGALNLYEVIDIMLQITNGIACAHASYIIHRDIKPQNILILDDGRVKITDFGIAVALNSNELTQTNSVMGSVHYLPPEQANGENATIKGDIYSTGILMYELLTGKVPFKGDNAVEIALKQMKEAIPSVREFNSEIPQSIENIVLKATAKNTKNRYDSVLEMYNDLKVALNEDKINEPKVVFQYPENDLLDDLEPAKVKMSRAKQNEDKRVLEDEVKKDKKVNKILLGSFIVTLLIIFIVVIAVLLSGPKPKQVETEIVIPDVTGMSITEAEAELENLGFVVKDEVTERNSADVAEGKVMGTSPKIGRTLKNGSTITLIVSKGLKGFTLENYVGQSYFTVKASLEANGIIVELKEEEHVESDGLLANSIISQDKLAGEEIKTGETLTLTITKIIVLYPDLTTYSLTDARAFARKNGITLEEEQIETSSYPEGSIISQTKVVGEKVTEGDTIKVVVAKAPKVVVKEETKPETNNTTTETNTDNTNTNTENTSTNTSTDNNTENTNTNTDNTSTNTSTSTDSNSKSSTVETE